MALQEGLPLFIRPFSVLASRVGCDESEVLERIRHWCAEGIIKRFGVVVRHHELGYTANAMLVHDVPDDAVAGDRRDACPRAGSYPVLSASHGYCRNGATTCSA
jgi:DNA-binding Lrp family transcriptional regulator